MSLLKLLYGLGFLRLPAIAHKRLYYIAATPAHRQDLAQVPCKVGKLPGLVKVLILVVDRDGFLSASLFLCL